MPKTTIATQPGPAPDPALEPADVEQPKLRTFVAGDTFIAETTEQGTIRIRLRFKTKLLRQIKTLDDPEDQFFALLDGIGDTDAIAKMDETDVFETGKIIEDFFAAYEAKHEAALGKSSSSST